MFRRELSKAEVYMSILTVSIQVLVLVLAWVIGLDYYLEKDMMAKGINIEEILKK